MQKIVVVLGFVVEGEVSFVLARMDCLRDAGQVCQQDDSPQALLLNEVDCLVSDSDNPLLSHSKPILLRDLVCTAQGV